MALTRKMLKAMGIEEDVIEQIIDAHTDVTESLKKERDSYKADSEKLEEVQKEYEDLKKQVEDNDDESYKEKYEKEHKDFEDYKASINADKAKAKKTEAYKALLRDAGVSEKRIGAVVKVTSMDDIELDEEGKVKDSDKIIEKVKEEWSDFIVIEEKKGAETKTPPGNDGGASGKELSRAAQVALKHNERMYGVKGDN